MAGNFLPIHCRKPRRHIPSRDHQRWRQHCLLPRSRQRYVVPARQRHGTTAGDRPPNHEGNDRGSPLSRVFTILGIPRSRLLASRSNRSTHLGCSSTPLGDADHRLTQWEHPPDPRVSGCKIFIAPAIGVGPDETNTVNCPSACIGGFISWKMIATTIVERWRAIEVLHLVAVCEGDFTHRKPR